MSLYRSALQTERHAAHEVVLSFRRARIGLEKASQRVQAAFHEASESFAVAPGNAEVQGCIAELSRLCTEHIEELSAGGHAKAGRAQAAGAGAASGRDRRMVVVMAPPAVLACAAPTEAGLAPGLHDRAGDDLFPRHRTKGPW